VKDNVTLNLVQISLEASIAAVGILFIVTWNTKLTNRTISDVCRTAVNISQSDADQADLMYQMKNPRPGELSMNLLISAVVA